MPITCTSQSLADEARCYECIPIGQRKPVIIYLLCLITGIAPDAQALMTAAKCYECIPPGFTDAVEMNLLAEIIGGTGGAPDPPSNFQASNGRYPLYIRLTWTNSPSAQWYEIWRSTTPDSSTAILIGTSTGSPYDDSTVTPGTDYYYWVKTVTGTGTSGFSPMGTGTVLDPPTVTAPDDFNYFTLTWPDFAPGQRYIVTMLQQGATRDYVQDLALGELTCEINNAFWVGGVRIDHTVDWPTFWITSADGTKATSPVQPHWPMVTPPAVSISGCNAPVLLALPPLFTYMPTSNRSSPSIQNTERYFEVFHRVTYDTSDPLAPAAHLTMTGDVGDLMRFSTTFDSPTIASANPAVTNVVVSASAALVCAAKCRAFRNDGSGWQSPEVTLCVDLYVYALAQCNTWGAFGTYGAGPVTGLTAHKGLPPECTEDFISGPYNSLVDLENFCKGQVESGPGTGYLSRVVAHEVVTSHTDHFVDLCPCPGYQVIDQYTAYAFCLYARSWIFAIPIPFGTVPGRIKTNVYLGAATPDGDKKGYGAANVGGAGATPDTVQDSAEAMMTAYAHPNKEAAWTMGNIIFTLCDDTSAYGPC